MNLKVLFLSLLGRSFAYINNQPDPNANPSRPRAWMCSGKTNAELVGKLASAGIIKSPIVKRALLAVDRRDYVPSSRSDSAYQDNVGVLDCACLSCTLSNSSSSLHLTLI